jgi:hypothetical protein
MQRGVVTVFSAGNDGPDASMVQNVSPWGLTVAASTIDRRFPTVITLGNNATIVVSFAFLLAACTYACVQSPRWHVVEV